MEREQLIKLVTEAQNGKSEAMNELFSEFYNDVYYFALKTVKDSEIACDITQETFIENSYFFTCYINKNMLFDMYCFTPDVP